MTNRRLQAEENPDDNYYELDAEYGPFLLAEVADQSTQKHARRWFDSGRRNNSHGPRCLSGPARYKIRRADYAGGESKWQPTHMGLSDKMKPP